VDWVCANVEATAKPKMAIMAPIEINVFISDTGLGFHPDARVWARSGRSQRKIAPRRCRGCETTGEMTKMISL
jgi:hypothetical protein